MGTVALKLVSAMCRDMLVGNPELAYEVCNDFFDYPKRYFFRSVFYDKI